MQVQAATVLVKDTAGALGGGALRALQLIMRDRVFQMKPQLRVAEYSLFIYSANDVTQAHRSQTDFQIPWHSCGNDSMRKQ